MAKRVLFLYPGQSRWARLPGLAEGTTPADFFYGYFGAEAAGYKTAIGDTRKDPEDASGRLLVALERLRNRFTLLGLTRQRVRALHREFAETDIAISTTDAFSLSMSLYLPRHVGEHRPLLVGGFHGLTDMVDRVPAPLRGYAEARVRQALKGLDHLFFFGEKDREVALKHFGLAEEKTSFLPFGIDTTFWHPAEGEGRETADYLLAVGSDPQRDYATLLQARLPMPLNILTRLNIPVEGRSDVTLLRGSFHGSAITDVVLRGMYQKAAAVVVPIKDVNQPSGYSVTLQAMACGRPVILSRIRGLWDKDLLRDGENCLLVPPGDAVALSQALERVVTDTELRNTLAANARETACRHFGVERMDNGLVAILDRLSAETPAG